MNSLEEILQVIKDGEEVGINKDAICASLCYEMARQEMETNKGYAVAFAYLLNNSSAELAEIVAKYGADIMKDESEDHTVKLRNLGDWYSGIAPIETQTVAKETEGI